MLSICCMQLIAYVVMFLQYLYREHGREQSWLQPWRMLVSVRKQVRLMKYIFPFKENINGSLYCIW